MRLRILVFIVFVFLSSPSWADFVPDTEEKQEQLVTAIFYAEGGFDAEYLFGIRSVRCKGYDDCRTICRNTVRNNLQRWINDGRKVDYLTYLRNRFAPLTADNDPRGLNANWLKNVKYFLEKIQ